MMNSYRVTWDHEMASGLPPRSSQKPDVRETTLAALDRRTAKSLPGPDPGKFDVVHWDAELPGFGLRVLTSGTRTWIARCRTGGKQRVVALGKVAEVNPGAARKEARDILRRAGMGQDFRIETVERRAKAAETSEALVRLYVARHVLVRLRPGSQVEVRRHLETHWSPLHGLPVHKLDRRGVAGRLAELATTNGPVAADRARASLSALFAWAMRDGLAEQNPVAGTNKPGVRGDPGEGPLNCRAGGCVASYVSPR